MKFYWIEETWTSESVPEYEIREFNGEIQGEMIFIEEPELYFGRRYISLTFLDLPPISGSRMVEVFSSKEKAVESLELRLGLRIAEMETRTKKYKDNLEKIKKEKQ